MLRPHAVCGAGPTANHLLALALRALCIALCVTAAAAACAQDPSAPQTQVLVPATVEHPRNGEGDIIQLRNGDLLLGYGRWGANGDDFGAAEIWAKTSHDGGKTWGEDRCLVPNEGKVTTFEVGFCRLKSGDILLSYCTKDSTEDCSVCFRRSGDEGQTWGDKVKYTIPRPYTGYTAINNGRLIQLSTGRVLLAVYDGWVRGTPIVSFALYSDDDGKTWQKSNDVDIRAIAPDNRYGADEPAVVELRDGRVMMIVRTDLGFIAKAISTDHGATFSKPEPIGGLVSPSSPASIARIPQTGDLLLIWNRSKTARNPLNSAISRDDGATWENVRVVDRGPAAYCYTSITPVGEQILLTYYGRGGFVLTSVPYEWFYEPQGELSMWLSEGPVEERSGKPPSWGLTKQACVYVQDTPEAYDGSKVTEVRATVVLHTLLPGKRATSMLWIGDPAPAMSCVLYLRAGEQSDAVSFAESMEPAYRLGDSGKPHEYRVAIDRAARQASLFVDGSDTAVLTTPLASALGQFDINRVLYGDPNVDFLGGDSELLGIEWK